MNLFDTLWAKLSTRLINIKFQPTNLDEFRQCLTEEWDAIPVETVHSVIDGMPRRIRLCTTSVAVKTAGKHDKSMGYAILNKLSRLNCSPFDHTYSSGGFIRRDFSENIRQFRSCFTEENAKTPQSRMAYLRFLILLTLILSSCVAVSLPEEYPDLLDEEENPVKSAARVDKCIDRCDDRAYLRFTTCIQEAEIKYERCLNRFTKTKSRCIAKFCVDKERPEATVLLMGELILATLQGTAQDKDNSTSTSDQ
ncbi:hypothetical protein CAPTEDRAFT_220591 [Capitella teleta]|uniref:Uncharacterized protein n=1 Tax=Capitella teleta TaxID=283909 RepID=R7TB22_CAPTE|nr:hypothetical protein CAPTEDRAFT_220591 [Capitella teleta]|eukprot:ELT90928.1 hypothetical protein CAPTEDRAFT_220591 [Capitella teleta]